MQMSSFATTATITVGASYTTGADFWLVNHEPADSVEEFDRVWKQYVHEFNQSPTRHRQHRMAWARFAWPVVQAFRSTCPRLLKDHHSSMRFRRDAIAWPKDDA